MRSTLLTTTCIALTIVALLPPVAVADDVSPEYRGFFPGSYGDGVYTSQWFTRWPIKSACLKTSRLQTTLFTSGAVGLRRVDPFNGDTQHGLAFPVGTGNRLMGHSWFMVGGIKDGDTLVSIAGSRDWFHQPEFYPPNRPSSMNALLPADLPVGGTYRTALVDTFTTEHLSDIWHIWNHSPLGLELRLKCHVSDDPHFANIVLLDLTLTNVGSSVISDAYVALEAEPVVWCETGQTSGVSDDIVGGLREAGAVYAIDNDGDPFSHQFVMGESVTDALGIAIAGLSHPAADTAFNWYRPGDPTDSLVQPMTHAATRDFANDPSEWKDPDLYHMLSNQEWDYDQCIVNSIEPDDPVWEVPDPNFALDVANGAWVQLALSVGPYDLQPDSSVRVLYALFGADAVHVDPNNGQLLDDGQYQIYRENLQFDIFRRRLGEVRTMVDRYTGPDTPPANFHVSYLSRDTVTLSWDPHLFTNTDGLLVEFCEVGQGDLVERGQVRPDPEFGSIVRSHFVPQGMSSTTVTGLDPGVFYLARIRHKAGQVPGRPSIPIVVGYGNEPLTPQAVDITRDFVFVPNNELTALTWEPSDDTAMDFYRIFRTTDENLIQWRHEPFFAVDSSLAPQFPSYADTTESGIPWFYYSMKPYDSVPASQPGYVDSNTVFPARYCVTAVNHYGYESPPSRIIEAVVGEPAARDILVIYGDTENFHDYVRKDSLVAFYERLLTGYDYDLYDFADSNRNVHAETAFEYNTRWNDISRYRVIIIDDFPEPAISVDLIEDSHTLMQRIISSGRDLLYFSVPAGHNDLHLGSQDELLAYRDESFVSRSLHIDSAEIRPWHSYERFGAIDSLAGFVGATPARDDLPDLPLEFESVRTTEPFAQLFQIDECLPMTGAFYPDSTAEVLYRYRSAYPGTSELQGMPCGIVSRHAAANAYAFSFHLWAIEESAARELIDHALSNQVPDTEFEPQLLPVGFSLYPNYPNPFNPTTTIRYNLNTGSHVLLEVYNILGRKVATLVDTYRTPGLYVVQWDGRTDDGNPVATGIYLYRIETQLGRDSRKMLLVR